jgi:YidC/Oxa1 family membrane protein insertase
MDRNSIIGLVLIAAIFIVFTIINKPSKEQVEAANKKQDSLALVEKAKSVAIEQAKITNENVAVKADSLAGDSAQQKALQANFGSFAEAAKGTNQFYNLENDVLKVRISSRGGRPYRVQLKNYKTYGGDSLNLFDGDSTVFGLRFYSNNRNISTNDLYFSPLDGASNVIVGENDSTKSLTMRLKVADDKYIDYTYTLHKGSYRVGFDVKLHGMKDVIAPTTTMLDLDWSMYVSQLERGRKNEQQYTEVYYKYSQDEYDYLSPKSKPGVDEQDISTRVNWVAFKHQFFSTVLISKNNFANATVKSVHLSDSDKYLRQFSTQVGIPYEPTAEQNINLSFYFGPNHYNTLKKEGLGLENLVSIGSSIIKWINKYAIIPVFNVLNQYMSNYGLIILILTILLKLVLYPLTFKSYLSQAKMRVLKPQIDEINERIPKEKPLERQQATMALYKKAGVSPLGGCLPMLLQFPILIAMYKFFPTSIELRQQGFLWANDLSTYDAIVQWDANIPIITWLLGNHISLFTVLMTVSTIISMKLTNQASASPQYPGMKTMMYMMPVMFLFILNDFSSGLTYYYFLANLISIAQNEIMKRSINEEKLLHKLNENKKKPQQKSKFQARLEAAAKARGVKMK